MKRTQQDKPSAQELYHGLLRPSCTVGVSSVSRKKMLKGEMPTTSLVKKAQNDKDCQPKKASPSPKPVEKKRIVPQRVSPVQVKPVEKKRIVPQKVSSDKSLSKTTSTPPLRQAVGMTMGQQKTNAMMQNLFARIEAKQGKYGKKRYEELAWN